MPVPMHRWARPLLRACLSSRRDAASGELFERMQAFITAFDANDLPKRDLQWAFSRSRGPGGQNVNKGTSCIM